MIRWLEYVCRGEPTGLGSQRDGDLMSGTVAAAAYCWEMGPCKMHQPSKVIFVENGDLPIPAADVISPKGYHYHSGAFAKSDQGKQTVIAGNLV